MTSSRAVGLVPLGVDAGLRALAHPVRLRMLSLLTGSALSAAELARQIGVSQANASYHLRQLADVGLVVAAGEQRVRGGTAKRYRYLPPAPADAGQPDGLRRSAVGYPLLVQALADELVRRSARHAGNPGLFADLELWVTPQQWTQAVQSVRAVADDLHAAGQPAGSPGTVTASASMVMFEMDPPT